jgi:hypothetical protein
LNDGKDYSDDDIEAMDWQKKTSLVQKDPEQPNKISVKTATITESHEHESAVTEAVDGNKAKDSDSNKRKNIFLFKCSFCSFLSFIVFKQHTDLSHNVFCGKKAT